MRHDAGMVTLIKNMKSYDTLERNWEDTSAHGETSLEKQTKNLRGLEEVRYND